MGFLKRRFRLSRLGDYGWVVFSTFTLLFVFSYMVRLSTGVLGPVFMEDLSLNAGQLGLLVGAFFYAFGAAQIPVGMALDYFGPKRTVIATSLLAVAGCILTGLASGIFLALGGRILIGLGMSSVLMGSLKIFTHWFKADRFAQLAGLIMSLGNLGGLLAATPLLLAAGYFGWRNCFFFFAAFVILMVLLILLLISDHPPQKGAQTPPEPGLGRSGGKEAMAARRAIFINPNFLIMGLGSFVRYGAMVTIQGFLGMLYLVDILKFSPQEAGNILGMMSVGYLAGSPLAGRLSDTVLRSRKKVVMSGFFLYALTMIPFLFQSGLTAPFWYVIFGAIGMCSATSPVNFAHAKELFSAQITGTVLTSSNVFVMLGGAVCPQVFGALLGQYPKLAGGYPLAAYKLIFLILMCASLLVGCLYLLVKDTGNRQATQ